MKCTNCGIGTVTKDTKSVAYSYKGRTTMIESITAMYCDHCDEFDLTNEEGDRFSSLMLQFNKYVDGV